MVKQEVELCEECYKTGIKYLAKQRCYFCAKPLCNNHTKKLFFTLKAFDTDKWIINNSELSLNFDELSEDDFDRGVWTIYCSDCYKELMKFLVSQKNFFSIAQKFFEKLKYLKEEFVK